MTSAFAASIAVSAGVLGPLIPPSIAFVIWGIVAEQSIGRLFLSGIVPGIVLALGLLVICWVHAWRNDVPRLPRATLRRGRHGLRARALGAGFAAGRAGRHLWRRLHADRGGRRLLRLCAAGRAVRREAADAARAAGHLRERDAHQRHRLRHHRRLGRLRHPGRAGTDRDALRDLDGRRRSARNGSRSPRSTSPSSCWRR